MQAVCWLPHYGFVVSTIDPDSPGSSSDLKELLTPSLELDLTWAAGLPRGKLPLRVTADGRWLYRDTAIERPGLLRLLADALLWMDGRHYLLAPEQLLAIEVEDTPFFIVSFERDEARDGLVLVSDREHRVVLDERHSLTLQALPNEAQQTPCIEVKEGLWARLSRSCYYQLVELANEGVYKQRPALLLASAGSEQLLGYLD